MRLSSLGKALFGLASARRSRPIMKLVCGSRYAIPGSASHRRMQDESSIDLRRPIQAFIDSTEDPASGPRSANTWSSSWAAIRDARVLFVSGRPGADEWLAKTARERQLQYASFLSIEKVITTVRQDGNRELCLLVVDGEDDSIHWCDVPSALRKGGAQLPCILIHPDLDEIDAFDAGYACLLKSRESRLLGRAIRGVVAGSSSLQSLADFSGLSIPGQTGLHTLVAEDNQISQQIIATMLQAGGHNVTLVSDGESVLESYRNASFDVIVLDMHMPGRTGLEVARAIRLLESKGQNRRTPIIMLTAAASTDLREDSLDAGVDLFLSKPVDRARCCGE